MDVRSLQFFLAVLEHGSITKASEQVCVAQPALGLRIRKLEEELGVQLVERHSRGVVATEAGSLLARHAEVVVRAMEKARQDLLDYAKTPSGRVTVGLTPTSREVVGEFLVRDISDNYPSVNLTIKEALSESLADGLLDGSIDVALSFNAEKGKDQLEFEPLARECIYFVYQKTPENKFGPTITLAEAIQKKLLLPSRPHLLRITLEKQVAEMGGEIQLSHEMDSVSALRDFVAMGVGYSVMPLGAVRGLLEKGVLGASRVIEPELPRTLYLAYSRKRPLSKSFETVVGSLRQAVKQRGNPDVAWEVTEDRQAAE